MHTSDVFRHPLLDHANSSFIPIVSILRRCHCIAVHCCSAILWKEHYKRMSKFCPAVIFLRLYDSKKHNAIEAPFPTFYSGGD